MKIIKKISFFVVLFAVLVGIFSSCSSDTTDFADKVILASMQKKNKQPC